MSCSETDTVSTPAKCNSRKGTTDMQIGFPGLLALIFITLKLTGVIAWRWLWVLSPIWIPLSIAAVFLIIALLIRLFTGE